MLKTQRFFTLFRHYAKHHGLPKDDLEFFFIDPLKNEDTPESVQLQRGDTIMVRKRRGPEPSEPAADSEEDGQEVATPNSANSNVCEDAEGTEEKRDEYSKQLLGMNEHVEFTVKVRPCTAATTKNDGCLTVSYVPCVYNVSR
jgi:hypothetical protein